MSLDFELFDAAEIVGKDWRCRLYTTKGRPEPDEGKGKVHCVDLIWGPKMSIDLHTTIPPIFLSRSTTLPSYVLSG